MRRRTKEYVLRVYSRARPRSPLGYRLGLASLVPIGFFVACSSEPDASRAATEPTEAGPSPPSSGPVLREDAAADSPVDVEPLRDAQPPPPGPCGVCDGCCASKGIVTPACVLVRDQHWHFCGQHGDECSNCSKLLGVPGTCTQGACVPSKADGEPCTWGEECASRYCDVLGTKTCAPVPCRRSGDVCQQASQCCAAGSACQAWGPLDGFSKCCFPDGAVLPQADGYYCCSSVSQVISATHVKCVAKS